MSRLHECPAAAVHGTMAQRRALCSQQGAHTLAGACCAPAHLIPVLPSVTVAWCPSAFIATAPSVLPGSSCCCMRAPLPPLFTRLSMMGAAPAPAALTGPPMPRALRLPRRGGGASTSSHLQGRLGGRAAGSKVQAQAGMYTGRLARCKSGALRVVRACSKPNSLCRAGLHAAAALARGAALGRGWAREGRRGNHRRRLEVWPLKQRDGRGAARVLAHEQPAMERRSGLLARRWRCT